jgi:hypothetical protein
MADANQAAALTEGGAGLYDDRANARLGLGDVVGAVADFGRAIGAFDGSVGPNAQPAGVDGFGLAMLYEARGRAEREAQLPGLAIADFKRAIAVLTSSTPGFRARLKEDIASARD